MQPRWERGKGSRGVARDRNTLSGDYAAADPSWVAGDQPPASSTHDVGGGPSTRPTSVSEGSQRHSAYLQVDTDTRAESIPRGNSLTGTATQSRMRRSLGSRVKSVTPAAPAIGTAGKKTKKGAAGRKRRAARRASAPSLTAKRRKALIKSLQEGRQTADAYGHPGIAGSVAAVGAVSEGSVGYHSVALGHSSPKGSVGRRSVARSRRGSVGRLNLSELDQSEVGRSPRSAMAGSRARRASFATTSAMPGAGGVGVTFGLGTLRSPAPAGTGTRGTRARTPGPGRGRKVQAAANGALATEVHILRAALSTLTNTVVEEVDRLRQENRSLKAAMEASMQATAAMAADAREDARQALRKADRVSETDSGWRESFAALRSTVEASQQATQPLHDRLSRLQAAVEGLARDVAARFSGQLEAVQARRSQVDAAVDGLRARFTDADDVMERLRRELQQCDRRRLEDMELVEAAVASVQESHRRLKTSAGDRVRELSTELRRLSSHVRRLETDVASVRAAASEAHNEALAARRDASQRLDSVGEVLRALASAAAAGTAAEDAPLRLV